MKRFSSGTIRPSLPSWTGPIWTACRKGRLAVPKPSKIEPWSAMDYGPALTATYEISDDGSNFAYKGVAVRLDAGPGGVSRGRHWMVFDHDTMSVAAAWTGDGFIDWNGDELQWPARGSPQGRRRRGVR